jgi:hypothetical protein
VTVTLRDIVVDTLDFPFGLSGHGTSVAALTSLVQWFSGNFFVGSDADGNKYGTMSSCFVQLVYDHIPHPIHSAMIFCTVGDSVFM